MDVHYFTFMGRNFANKKKLTPVQIMNNVDMNSVSTFNDDVVNSNFRE